MEDLEQNFEQIAVYHDFGLFSRQKRVVWGEQ